MIKVSSLERSGHYVVINFTDGMVLSVLENEARWDATGILPENFKITPEFFDIVWDSEHTFNFFEDENGDYLWADGSLDSSEFVRQANLYDHLSDPDSDAPGYTESDVRVVKAIGVWIHGEKYARLVREDNVPEELVTTVKLISR